MDWFTVWISRFPGVLVFAKNKKAAADLSNQISNGTMKKFYYALIYGTPIRDRDTLEDYLYKDGSENLSIIVMQPFRMPRRPF